MSYGIGRRVTALACVSALASCTYTKTFGYTPHYDVQVTGEDPEPAPVEARQLLASAKTVGFYPPDRCINTTDKAEEEKQFRANCGVLLSYLERSAEKAGYEVVSWVNLRATDNRRAIDYARDAKVDVLFEINEISVEKIQADANLNRSLTFFDRTDHGDVPITPSQNVVQRCYGWSRDHDQIPSFGDIATIDIKATSVADGRSRWHYRKAGVIRDNVVPASERFVGKSQPNKIGNGLGAAGTAILITGATFLLVDAAVASGTDPVTGMPKQRVFGDFPYYAMGAGAILLAGGAAIMLTQGQRKPSPESVLCDQLHVPNNGLYEGGTGPTPAVIYNGTQGGQASFTEQRSSQGSIDKAKMEKEIHDSVQEFVNLLVDVKQHPPPMPAATPPQP
jgi:hypothetical protein